MSGEDVIAVYDAQAAELADRYDRIGLLEAYAGMSALIAPTGNDPLALDVGAGSGRDAAWLAAQGYEVVAVEPAAGMRAEGQRRHPDAKVRWLDDRLPGLVSVHGLALGFDLILLSAVWQHVAPADRPRAFRKLTTLLKPGGLMLMTLRHGPAPVDRPMHPVSLSEVEGLARVNGVEVLRVVDKNDAMARSDVRWTMVALRMPDDGAGALPLIRGIILADDKSSTYKLALMRAVARIAEHAPATAVPAADDTDAIDIPLGLVALFWVRMYLPLVRAGLPQAPRNSGPEGLGFAKAGFRALLDQAFAPQELRVGATFAGERACSVHAAIGEAAATIATMPANFIRFPNSDHRVFGTLKARAGGGADRLQLDVAILTSWGRLRVPGHVWRAMARLGAWIEPVLVAKWTRLIRNYGERMGYSPPIGQAEAALAWEEPIRDTAIGRMAAERLFTGSVEIQCVWSGTARFSVSAQSGVNSPQRSTAPTEHPRLIQMYWLSTFASTLSTSLLRSAGWSVVCVSKVLLIVSRSPVFASSDIRSSVAPAWLVNAGNLAWAMAAADFAISFSVIPFSFGSAARKARGDQN
jgi:SAM-dependent methyltransferase